MKDLALRILQEETDGFELQSRLRDDVIDAMIRFKNETEQLNIPAVVGRSEQYCDCQEIIVADYIDNKYCSQCNKPMDSL